MERERERDIRGKGRVRPQQGDELLVKWLLFSWRASQLHFSGFSYRFPQSGAKTKTTGKKTGKASGLMGSFRGASGRPGHTDGPQDLEVYG